MTDEITRAIQACAAEYRLPWELVKAICQVESSMNPWAIRHEPGYRWLVGDSHEETEHMGQKTSWGLMQVMGAVAREYGFTGHFPRLCVPIVGLEYGCKHLAKFHDRYKTWPEAIVSYNAGRPVKIDGRYRNQEYLDKVLREWAALESPIPLKETEV